jgi:hypothetical protein
MITLSSDFGSPYPAAMKGVILQETDARLVDITHDFPRQDVRTAAFWLREVLPYFPPAVHLVVVDPGVGTDRRAIVLTAGDHVLVGPDNGVLVPAARALARRAGSDGDLTVYEIPVSAPESTTFHGRDVFAPAAAAVHDTPPTALDYPALTEFVNLEFPTPTVDGDVIHGEVLVVDDFGNAITNVPGDRLRDRLDEDREVEVGGERTPVRETYAAVDPGERVVTVGSHGNVELAVNRGRGDDAFGVTPGSEVVLESITD